MNTFTIYTNNTIKVDGALPTLRIKALNADGSKEFNVTTARRVRVYNYAGNKDVQPFVDFDIPSHIGGPSDWTTNPALADAIRAAFPAEASA